MTPTFSGLVAQTRALRASAASTHDYSFNQRVCYESYLAVRSRELRRRVTAGGPPPGEVMLVSPDQVENLPIPENPQGRPFSIPLVIPEGLESGDGRSFKPGALSRRELPLPLMWQIQTNDAHDGSVVVGRIDSLDRIPGGMGNARGVFDTGPYGQEAQRLVENKMLRWVSADLDKFEADQLDDEPEKTELGEEIRPEIDDDHIGPERMLITKGRIMGVTLLPKPAFQECIILLDDDESGEQDVADGVYSNPSSLAASAATLCAAVPIHPPKSWFTQPALSQLTPITVDDTGHVYGHIASWDVDHIGMPFGTRAPHSRSNYAYFHTGVVRTEEGDDVSIGQLTLSGGHAPLNADAASAIKHYDDTKSAVADVRAGEDSYGIWVSGALRPDVSPEQVRMFRASAPSGDWRQIRGALELVAVCQVNVPGFPVTRAQVASGAVFALVAAGAQTLTAMHAAQETGLESRLRRLENAEKVRQSDRANAARTRVASALDARRAERVERAQAIRSRVDPLLAARREQQARELSLRAEASRARLDQALGVDEYMTAFKDFSKDKREQLAKKKHAMKDGSFPIENVADLKRAIRAYGRTSKDKQAQVRRHIIRRARGLGKPDLIPDSWSENSLDSFALSILDAKDA